MDYQNNIAKQSFIGSLAYLQFPLYFVLIPSAIMRILYYLRGNQHASE